ncbi:sporulation protein YpjB [Paenibacillus tarimensis]
MMRKWITAVILTSLIITAYPVSGIASDIGDEAAGKQEEQSAFSHSDKLLQLSKNLYQAATDGNRQLVFYYFNRLERLAADKDYRQYGSSHGWSAVDRAISGLRSALQPGKPYKPYNDMRTYGAQLLLAFDALVHEKGALWKTYHEVLTEDVNRIVKAWRRNTGDGAEAAFAAVKPLSDHIRLIVPAALMKRDQEQVVSLQEAYRYTYNLLEAGKRGELDREWMEQALNSLSNAIDILFQEPGDRLSEPVISPVYGSMPWRWTIVVALLILSVLGYVGWQKFLYERDKMIKHHPSNLP